MQPLSLLPLSLSSLFHPPWLIGNSLEIFYFSVFFPSWSTLDLNTAMEVKTTQNFCVWYHESTHHHQGPIIAQRIGPTTLIYTTPRTVGNSISCTICQGHPRVPCLLISYALAACAVRAVACWICIIAEQWYWWT